MAIPFSTLVEALLAAPDEQKFVTMWHDEDDVRNVTFGEFKQQCRRQAALLLEHGVRRGETVILIMPQGIPVMAAFMGAMLLGAVPSILAYPNFKVEAAKYRSGLAGVSRNLNARVVMLDKEFPEEFLSYVSVGEEAQVVRYDEKTASACLPALTEMQPEMLAFIQHSAGTTGLQKGVALSHAAVLRQLEHLRQILDISAQDRIYSWLPLYHDMGLIACFMLPMVYHLPVVMQSPTEWVMQPGTMPRLIGEYGCTLAWAPNFTLQFLARRVHPDDRKECDLSSLRAFINCSEPVRAQSQDEFKVAYASSGLSPCVLQSSYAMAENVFAVTHSALDQPPQRLWLDAASLRDAHLAVPVEASAPGALCLVSSGQCLPGNEVCIVDAEGGRLPNGAVGEILVRSDSLFNGYYNRPDLTELSLKNGWYWSGDLGLLWQDELYVIGRKKDLIIVAGKNIHPADVEEVVSSHTAISDGRSVVLGLFNPDLGTEDIVVVAELRDPALLSDTLQIERAVRNNVVAELGVAVRAVYLKPPRWIVKSTAGKPARTATRDKLLAEHPELFPKSQGELQ